MASVTEMKASPARPQAGKGKRTKKQRRESTEQAAHWVIAGSTAAILVTAAIQAYQHARQLLPMITARFQFDYEEGNILNALNRILHGLSPYPDPHALPNVLNPYGPVAYYLLSVPARLAGLGFSGARILIALCVLATCVMVSMLVWKETKSILTGAAFGLMYGAFGVVRDWSGIVRVDFLSVALATAGVFCFAQFHNRFDEASEQAPLLRNMYTWLSVCFFTAGVFTKPNCVAAPMACLLVLLIERRARHAWQFAALLGSVCLAMLAACVLATRGTIITHMFLSHPDPFLWSAYFDRLAALSWTLGVLVIFAVVRIVSELKHKTLSLASAWLLLSLMTAVTAGKLGSNTNHFLEWPVALCLVAAAGWTIITGLEARVLAAVLSVAGAVAVILMLAGQTPSRDFFAGDRDCPAAYEFVRNSGGEDVLSENVGAVVLAGKRVWVSNLFVYSQLIERGGWQDAGMNSMIAARRFSLIATSRNYLANRNYALYGSDRFPPEAIQAMAQNYHLAAAFQCRDASFMFLPN